VGLPPTITLQAKNSPPLPPAHTFIAYASEPGRPAFEQPDAGRWQGAFTRCLLTILRRSTHGIRASELKRALEREVQSFHSSQRAQVHDAFREDSTFGRRSTLPQLAIQRVRAQGEVTLLDGSFAVIARWSGAGVWQLPLPLGLYKLADEAGHRVVIEHDREVTHVAL
jgi:hypothetical protein